MDAPAVAVSRDGKQMAAAWMDMRAGSNNRDVQWCVGSPAKLGAEKAANDSSQGIQGHPSLAFDAEGTAWIAWEDGRVNPNALRIYVSDARTRKNVAVSAESEGKCAFPTLAAAGPLLGVIYESGGSVTFRIVPR